MRSFEFARKMELGKPVVDDNGVEVQAYPDARLPEYATEHSAGADFFCAEDVTVPSIWSRLFYIISHDISHSLRTFPVDSENIDDIKEVDKASALFNPTMVHTGIKSCMEDDDVLELYNRSSNPKHLGLILANGVGVIDSDYYENRSNDGEIMFAFYNIKPWSVKLRKGDRIGQGVFKKFLRPSKGLVINSRKREGGIGSTGRN